MSEQNDKKAFQQEVDAWMAANKPADPGLLLPQSFMEVGSEQQLDFLREWQYKVWSAGYLGMHWPREYGGQGADPVFQTLADQAMRKHRVPIMFNIIGLGWAGPLINDKGSEAEKAKYLKGILTADDVWCQGFSEPDHGSDLGNAQTKAQRDGDEYVINGTKIWTTMGNFARYMILLARTDASAERKYDGLSFFLAPMHTEGIEARPIQKLTGEYGFTETFFTDARIPADCLMGEEGQGWKIAMQTLMYERGAEAGAATAHSMISIRMSDLLEMVSTLERDDKPLLQDAQCRDQLVQLMIEEQMNALSAKRMSVPALTSDFPMSLPLSSKLRLTEWSRRMRQFALQLQGGAGSLYVGDDAAIAGGFWPRAYMNNFSLTIGGGTSQIQANIVGEHVLGLPKS